MKKNKKLPTIVGIIILTLGIIAGVFLINSRQVFKLNAQTEASPQNVRIGNITNSSITVTWTTDKESLGFLRWNEEENRNLKRVAQESDNQQSNIHLAKIEGAQSAKTIYFIINSNGENYSNENLPWQVDTSSQILSASSSLSASGTVFEQDGTTPAKAIVHLVINGNLFSTITSTEGSWVVPVGQYLNPIDESTTIEIQVNAGPKGTAQAVATIATISNTPAIVLGKTYDFRNINQNQDQEILPVSEPEVPEIVEESRFEFEEEDFNIDDLVKNIPVTLDSVEDGEVITTQNPEFFGQGPTASQIQITVESELQSATTEVNDDGFWSWTPPNNLTPGEHTVTLKWKDENGILKTITRNFIVSASEGPAFEASSSGSLLPTPTPTPLPTSTPTTEEEAENETPETGFLTTTLILFILGIGLTFGSGLLLTYENAKN